MSAKASLRRSVSRMRSFLRTKKGKTTAIVVGGGALAYFALRQVCGSDLISCDERLLPDKVGKSELVSTHFYRILAMRRPKMIYVPANGSMGGRLEVITPPEGGYLTHNAVIEGGQIMLEFKV